MKNLFNKVMLMLSTFLMTTGIVLGEKGTCKCWHGMGMHRCPITKWAHLVLMILAIIALSVWIYKQMKMKKR